MLMACELGRKCSGFARARREVIDATLAGLIAFVCAVCIVLLWRGRL
jgi:hypothetical protein